MNIKQYQPIFLVAIISAVALLLHKGIFMLLLPNQVESEFVYSLPILYGFFLLLSASIMFILIKVGQASMTNVGLTFILLTTFKMGIAFVFLKPILKTNLPHIGLEKTNFLIVFLLFLTIETLITIRLINNKQE
ncbi:MAG: hypothetical protein V4648_02160 [Bacteroidota bacterium]